MNTKVVLKMDVKIIFGEYKGYTGRIISGKKKDINKIFSNFSAGTKDFFIGQLETVKNKNRTEEFEIGDIIKINDGPLRGFSGSFEGIYLNENNQKIVRLSNITGYKVIDKNEVEMNDLILMDSTAEDNEKYEINIFTSSQHTKVFLFRKQFEVLNPISRVSTNETTNSISRVSTNENKFEEINVFDNALDGDNLDVYDVDDDNFDVEGAAYDFKEKIINDTNNDNDNNDDGDELDDNIFNNQEEDNENQEYSEEFVQENSYKDEQRTVKTDKKTKEYRYVENAVKAERTNFAYDINFKFEEFVSDIYNIYKFVKTNPDFLYRGLEFEADINLIIKACFIKYNNKNVDDDSLIIKVSDRSTLIFYGGLYKYIKNGNLLQNIDDNVDLEELSLSVNNTINVEFYNPKEIITFADAEKNNDRKKRNFEETSFISKKNKYLRLDNVVVGVNKDGQKFSVLDSDYYNKQDKIEEDNKKQIEMLKNIDEINEIRTREWKKVPSNIFEGGRDKYHWVLKKSSKQALTLNPDDMQSYNNAKENYEFYNKNIDKDGGKKYDSELSGSMEEQYNNLTENGIPPSEMSKRIAEEHGVDEIDIRKLMIVDNSVTIKITSPVKDFIIPFFDFMNSKFKDSVDDKLGLSINSIYVAFVRDTNIKLSYSIFNKFMKSIYTDYIKNDFLIGLRFKTVFDLSSKLLIEYNNELISTLKENTVPFYKYISGKEEKDNIVEFIDTFLCISDDIEENDDKNRILIDDLYNQYRTYFIRKAKSNSSDRQEKYLEYSRIVEKLVEKDIFIAIINSGDDVLDSDNNMFLSSKFCYKNEYIDLKKRREQFLKEFVENAYDQIFQDFRQNEMYKELVPDINDLYTIAYLIRIGNNINLSTILLISEQNYFEHFLSYGVELMSNGFESKLKILMSAINQLTSMRNVSSLIENFVNNWDTRSEKHIEDRFYSEIEAWAHLTIEKKSKKEKNLFGETPDRKYYMPLIFKDIRWNKTLYSEILERVNIFLTEPLEDMKKNPSNPNYNLLEFREYYGEDSEKMDSDKVLSNDGRKNKKYENILSIMNKNNNRINSGIKNLDFSTVKREYSVGQDLWDLTMEYMENVFTTKDIKEKDFTIWDGNNSEKYMLEGINNVVNIDKTDYFGWNEMKSHLTIFYKEYYTAYNFSKMTFTKNIKFIDFFIKIIKHKLSTEIKLKNEFYDLGFSYEKFITYFYGLTVSVDFTFEKFFKYLCTQIYGIEYNDFIDYFAFLYKDKENEIPSSEDMLKKFKEYLIHNKKIVWLEKDYRNSSLYKNYKILFDIIEFICKEANKSFSLSEEAENIENLMGNVSCLEYQIKNELFPDFVKRLDIPLSHIKKIVNRLDGNKQILEKNFKLNFSQKKNENSSYILFDEIDGKNDEKMMSIVKNYFYIKNVYDMYIEQPDSLNYESIDTNICPVNVKEKIIDKELLESRLEKLEAEMKKLKNKVFYSFEVSEESIQKKTKYYIKHVKNTSYGEIYDQDLFSDKWKKECKIYDSGNYTDINNEDNKRFYYYLNICLFKSDLVFYDKELDNKYTNAAKTLYNLMTRVGKTQIENNLKKTELIDKNYFVYITNISKNTFDNLFVVRSSNKYNYPYYAENYDDALLYSKTLMDSFGYNYMQKYKVKEEDSDELKNAIIVFVKYPFCIKEKIVKSKGLIRYFVYDCYSSISEKLLSIFNTEYDSNIYIRKMFENMGFNRPFLVETNDPNVRYFRDLEIIDKKIYQNDDVYIDASDETRKEMFDIVGYTQGFGDEKGCIIFLCSTPENKKFLCIPKGTLEERFSLYEEGKKYIGLQLIVEFQGYDNNNMPRFPEGLEITQRNNILE